MRLLCGREELRIEELGAENHLAVVNRFDLRSFDHEVTCSLDVDDEMIAFDPADRTDLFATFFEKHVVADADFESMSHDFDLRAKSSSRIARANPWAGGTSLAFTNGTTMDDLERLRAKLCRELAQSERSAEVHTRREARRLGDIPPAYALLALGAHARAQRPRFESIVATQQPERGLRIAHAVGQLFSTLRNLVLDRVIDTERSFRGTLLGFRHGIDVTRLLREVSVRLGDERMRQFCDEWLEERLRLVHGAERQLAWFADVPHRALKSGLGAALAAK